MISFKSVRLMLQILVLASIVFYLPGDYHGIRIAPQATPTAAAIPINTVGRVTQGQLAILDPKGQPVGVCPLQHTDVSADVSGYVARVTVKQTFHNPSTGPVEAVYTFPLPGDAAVDDMTMTIGDRVIKGDIKRREEARQIYEAAKAAGKSAALLDQERPNIFTQSVANILPGKEIAITISYVNLLKYDEGRYEFVFPMVVGPRYVPGGGLSTPGVRGAPSPPVPNGATGAIVTDAEKITPPITPEGTRAGHDISLKVNLDAGVPLGAVTSVLHPIDITRKGDTGAEIKLKNANTIPNKDFILRYTVAGAGIQSGVLAYSKGEGSGFFTLILQPPAAPPAAEVSPKEMIFVIDQTGSQGGWPIAKAKETMKYCMSHLNPGDTFQLLGFNTELFPCFEKPVPATPDNIAKAQAFLAPIEGNGGTDILKSVEYALKLPTDPARPRIICYMTDGYVGNDMQIIDCVKKNRGDARMFPFGVGNSVNRFLIDGMAREGRGVADYVTLDESGEVAAERFYKRVAQPLLLDVKVDWKGLPVREVYPKAIPDVFTASPIILKGRYSGPAEGDITVSGLLRGKPWREQVHVQLPEVQDEGSGLQSLWAREKIDDLQEQDWIGAQLGKPDLKIKDAIVEVALENRLMSQWTSFVAVEQRVVNIGGKVRTLDVPVEMPEGVSYSGIFGEPGATASNSFGFARSMRRAGAIQGQVAHMSGAGGFGGGAGYPGGGQFGAVGGAAAPLAALASPVAGTYSAGVDKDGALLGDSAAFDEPVISGSPAGQKRLDAMKPEERLALLQKLKLDAKLQGLAAAVKKDGVGGTLHKPGLPDVDRGRVEVQIWLNELPPNGLARLKALGFDLAVALKPGKLLLGTVTVDQLDALIALPFVRRIEPPRFH